jgi:predicted nucleotidyltransferase component of viral defense system
MPSSEKDYRKLYRLQDKFLHWWAGIDFPFYLTGGTALGRYYLHHRFSEDLDFFVNADAQYPSYISVLKTIISRSFQIDPDQSLFTEDYTRLFISDKEGSMKIEFVNEVEYRVGQPIPMPIGLLDTPDNILSNKLAALISRDEPKDIFDIIYLALNYSFEWPEIFHHSRQKAVLNEIDVEERLSTFPIHLLEKVDWLDSPPDLDSLLFSLRKIADDFLLGRTNSLGINKIPIDLAKPVNAS